MVVVRFYEIKSSYYVCFNAMDMPICQRRWRKSVCLAFMYIVGCFLIMSQESHLDVFYRV
jgi:hypothetical protein